VHSAQFRLIFRRAENLEYNKNPLHAGVFYFYNLAKLNYFLNCEPCTVNCIKKELLPAPFFMLD